MLLQAQHVLQIKIEHCHCVAVRDEDGEMQRVEPHLSKLRSL